MKERGIILHAHEVRAILDGRQTQLRRVIRPQPEHDEGVEYWKETFFDWQAFNVGNSKIRCPLGQPGDRLWGRETFAHAPASGEGPIYRADKWAAEMMDKWRTDPNYPQLSWRPSVHMPRWASRILLEVTGVRVERNQDTDEWEWVVSFQRIT